MEKEPVYIGTRVEPDLKEIIEKVAKERGMNVSDFLRFLVKRELARLSFLSEDTKKAFGLLKKPEESDPHARMNQNLRNIRSAGEKLTQKA